MTLTKNTLQDEENLKIKELEEKKEQIIQFLEKADNNMRIVNKKTDALNQELLEVKTLEQKNKMKQQQEIMLRETDEKIMKLKDKIKIYDEDLKSNEALTIKLNEKIEDNLIDEKAMHELSIQYKKSKDSYLSLKMKEASTTQSIKETNTLIEKNSVEQEKKKTQIEKVQQKKALEHWLSNHFINLIDIIEKNVMASIRAEFKEHFEEWFNMLIEDESISATLDERFTPVITQNGYDTEIENLSGGEKTSVALAYRLALNKVINSMISTIKTKDLLILDEPTDGFSSHQLDKVREVLDALNSKQTIIVSHESKMESFVDHIIKIRKHEHASEVM